MNDQQLRSVISNPTGEAFRDRYLPMGKAQGKKTLRNDCYRIGMRIPIKGMQLLEMGYSRKNKISWENNQNRHDYDPGSLAFNTSTGKLGKGRKSSAQKQTVQADGTVLDQWGRTVGKVDPTVTVPVETVAPSATSSSKPPLIITNQSISHHTAAMDENINYDSWDD